MKIRIRLINSYGDTVRLHVLDMPNDPYDDIEAAVIKLLTHDWTLSPGDSIRIGEA